MKKVLFLALFPILCYGQTAGIMGINSIQPITGWTCFDQQYNRPPFAPEYAGGVCGYDHLKLITIPYWYHCDGTNKESYYWIRTWDNAITGMVEKCYDRNHRNYHLECNGYEMLFNAEEDIGRYLQIDLYSQCTNCTDGPWTGSWWSTKGNEPNPPSNIIIGWIPAKDINTYRENLLSNECDALCFNLLFVGSPSCDCFFNSSYGCGEDDQH